MCGPYSPPVRQCDSQVDAGAVFLFCAFAPPLAGFCDLVAANWTERAFCSNGRRSVLLPSHSCVTGLYTMFPWTCVGARAVVGERREAECEKTERAPYRYSG